MSCEIHTKKRKEKKTCNKIMDLTRSLAVPSADQTKIISVTPKKTFMRMENQCVIIDGSFTGVNA